MYSGAPCAPQMKKLGGGGGGLHVPPCFLRQINGVSK